MDNILERVGCGGEQSDEVRSTPDPTREAFEAAIRSLGRPAARGDRYAIYHADTLDLLPHLPPGSIDLTVTSPPYNIGKEYEQVRSADEYIDWCCDWIKGIHSATSDRGAFWLNLGYLSLPGRARAVPIPYLIWERVPFFLMQEIVWNYGAGVAARKAFSPRNEKFLWYVKSPDDYVFDLDAVRDPDVKYPNQKKNGKLKCNPLGKNPSDVWQFPKVTSGANRSSRERTPHPAQFPTAVIDRIVRASSGAGELVLDPFLGSGSTIEAALSAGRCAIGIEIDDRYVELAIARVSRFLEDQQEMGRQGSLL